MTVERLSRWLLLAVSGDAEAEFVLGDVEEEFALIAADRGPRAAAWWLAGQAVRSAAPLASLRIRSGEMTHALLAGASGAALPLYACDSLWRFVHSQIPLKDGVEREPWQLAINLICLCACAVAAGGSARTPRRSAAVSAALLIMTAGGLWASRSPGPAAYQALALAFAPAAAFWRRSE